ncbi:Uncharacterised protein [Burkholderia pseudomallei]|nr:Uncharacterised protein [Burkholderia pseudomallei]
MIVDDDRRGRLLRRARRGPGGRGRPAARRARAARLGGRPLQRDVVEQLIGAPEQLQRGADHVDEIRRVARAEREALRGVRHPALRVAAVPVHHPVRAHVPVHPAAETLGHERVRRRVAALARAAEQRVRDAVGPQQRADALAKLAVTLVALDAQIARRRAGFRVRARGGREKRRERVADAGERLCVARVVDAQVQRMHRQREMVERAAIMAVQLRDERRQRAATVAGEFGQIRARRIERRRAVRWAGRRARRPRPIRGARRARIRCARVRLGRRRRARRYGLEPPPERFARRGRGAIAVNAAPRADFRHRVPARARHARDVGRQNTAGPGRAPCAGRGHGRRAVDGRSSVNGRRHGESFPLVGCFGSGQGPRPRASPRRCAAAWARPLVQICR